MQAFSRAVDHAKRTGFECDVRLSKDQVPVVIHDKTLRRTHRRGVRVNHVLAKDLAEWGVPPLARVLPLASARTTIVLDLKERPAALLRAIRRLCRRAGASPAHLVCLVRAELRAVPRGLTVYRARNYRFPPAPGAARGWGGIACKYSGTAVNRGCIRSALAAGVPLNLYAPDKRHTARMMREYAGRGCTFTV